MISPYIEIAPYTVSALLLPATCTETCTPGWDITIRVSVEGFGESCFTLKEGPTPPLQASEYERWVHGVATWLEGLVHERMLSTDKFNIILDHVYARINHSIGGLTKIQCFSPGYWN